MKIKITGISGYLGAIISEELTKQGHDVSGIQRKFIYGSIETLSKQIEGADIIINLAGAPILQRWTDRTKRLIYESRVRTSTNIVKAINSLPKEKQPSKFISASAVGIYKPGMNHDESSTNFDTDFVGKVVQDWEAASNDLPSKIQKIIFRIGIVLGKEAKSVKNLILPTKMGLAATLGNGEQAFPFIHEKDLLRAFLFAVNQFDKSETFNLVAPEQINNKQFTKSFAKHLNRNLWFSIPTFLLKTGLGEASTLLTEGAWVYPKNLLDAGFEFKYPSIEDTLSNILS